MSTTSPADAALERAALSGVFTVPMALNAGLTRSAVRHRIAQRVWTPVAGAAFVRASSATEWQRCVAAALTWPEGVIGMRTAARLHGLPVDDDGQVHVVLANGRRSRRSLRAHHLTLDPGEVARRGPVRFTDRRRTIIDCLARLPAAEAEDLLAWVRTRELITCEEIEAAIRARKEWTGTRQLRRLHRSAVDGALSEGERRLHAVLRGAGISGWRADARVVVDGRIVARVDVLFEEQRVVVELDGRRAHRDFQADRERLNVLMLAGYVVLHFTWEDVTERPEVVVAAVRRALGLVR